MASAVLTGSLGSGGGGARDVLTEQNLQPLVHWSPRIIMVAVAVRFSPPPQHSPILGHLASSHTYDVSNYCTLIKLKYWYDRLVTVATTVTYCIQLEFSQVCFEFGVIFPNGYVRFKPFRQSEPTIKKFNVN